MENGGGRELGRKHFSQRDAKAAGTLRATPADSGPATPALPRAPREAGARGVEDHPLGRARLSRERGGRARRRREWGGARSAPGEGSGRLWEAPGREEGPGPPPREQRFPVLPAPRLTVPAAASRAEAAARTSLRQRAHPAPSAHPPIPERPASQGSPPTPPRQPLLERDTSQSAAGPAFPARRLSPD